jgi:hypothetical protein
MTLTALSQVSRFWVQQEEKHGMIAFELLSSPSARYRDPRDVSLSDHQANRSISQEKGTRGKMGSQILDEVCMGSLIGH